MNPLIKWIGGKVNSVKIINKILPPHSCFIEVFAGGLSIFFGREQPSKIEVINDLNGELINLYKIIQQNPKEFIERSKYELYSRKLFDEYVKDFNLDNHLKLSNLERGFRFYCIVRESFSGIFGSGWSFSCKVESPKIFQNSFDIIDSINKRLKNVYIENRDFQYVIEHWDCEDVCMFLDPPYIKPPVDDYYFKSFSGNFTIYDHQRLYNSISKMKGKFILTIDDCSFVRERYINNQEKLGKDRKFWFIENVLHYASSSNEDRKHVTELIITNYDINKVIEQNKLNIVENTKSLLDY